ncbi:MAG: Protease inhibitor precursor [Firmicutes bacterium ADurb.Bin419]|nr:MAG: Protease inhibitor precursor [Firmicutes bacterium ADurb.Bin419]
MNKSKKAISLLIISGMLIMSSAVSFANEELMTTSAEEVNVVAIENQAKTISYIVEVEEVNSEEGKVVSILTKENGEILRQFNIDESIIVMDNENGIPKNISEIKKGDKICVVASRIETRSIPPQSPAYVILTDMDKKSPAKYIKVGSIDINENGLATVTDEDGEYIIRIGSDTVLLPYKTRNMISVNDIKVGSEFLMWSEIMTLSLPAQVNPEKVVLLPEKVQEKQGDKIIISTMAGVISINGRELYYDEDTETFYKNEAGEWMVPVRRVASELGYEVNWIGETKGVDLIKENQSLSMQIGKSEYSYNGLKTTLSQAPELKGSRTFVPVTFLQEIMNIEVIINEGHI